VNLAFHDAQFASAGFLGLTRGIPSSGRSRSSRTSDTPVASRRLLHAVAWCVSPGRRGRFLRPSVKMRRSLRPEVPSIAGGRPRTCVSRFRLRDAVTCVSATTSALAIPSPVAPPAPLSRCRRLLRARPPSLPTVPLAMFTREAGERFSGSDGRPTTSATTLPTHGHTLEHPFPAKIRVSRLCGDPEPALASTALFYGAVAFPCRRRTAKAASRDNPFKTDPAALQTRNGTRP